MLKALARHSYWNAVATFAHQGSTFLSNFLVIKLLDHASYGKFALLNLTAFYAAAILQFAVGSTASRFDARYADKREQLLSVIGVCAAFSLASGLLGFGILIVGSEFFRLAFLRNRHWRPRSQSFLFLCQAWLRWF